MVSQGRQVAADDRDPERDVLEKLRRKRVAVEIARHVRNDARMGARHRRQDLGVRQVLAAEPHEIGDSQCLGTVAKRLQLVALAVDLEPQTRNATLEQADGIDQGRKAVGRRDAAVVDDTKPVADTGMRGRGKEPLVDGVHHDRDLVRRHAARRQRSLVRLVHRHHAVGERRSDALDQAENPVDNATCTTAEAHAEHVRSKVVDVEHDACAEQLGHEHGDDEEVGRVVHLHDVPAPSRERASDRGGSEQREAEVLTRDSQCPVTPLMLDRQPSDPHTRRIHFTGGLAAPACSDHVDLPAGVQRRLSLAYDTRLADRIRAVDDHEEAASHRTKAPVTRRRANRGGEYRLPAVKAAAKEVFGCVVRFSGLAKLVRATFGRGRAAILVYHDPPPERLRAHLAYLAPRFDLVSLPELVDALRSRRWEALPSRPLVLTLDDGQAGNAALEPVLREFGARPTFYVCSQIVDTNRHFWFRDAGGHFAQLLDVSDEARRQFLAERLGFVESAEHAERQALSRDELVSLAALADIGSHTQWHPVLPACSDAVARTEIFGSKTELEAMLGRPCEHFCFPNGNYSLRDVDLVKAAGYLSARTTDFGWIGADADPFRLPILAMPDDASVNTLAAYLGGILALKRAVKPRRRVVPVAS